MITNNYELKCQKISIFQLKSLFVIKNILATIGIVILFEPLNAQTLQDIENVRKQYQEALIDNLEALIEYQDAFIEYQDALIALIFD